MKKLMSCTLQLREGPSARSVNLDDLRIIDYAQDGEIVGVEFISATEGVELRDIPFRPTVENAIRDSGFKLKLFA